ncbi:hypothetical protein CRUP_031491 [Coryphaenoides rupestris]|nr:hypothetical protein CRUP_031491 [Coryphaenoides rupestris]
MFSAVGSSLSDGQWHTVRLVAKENFAMLTVDGDEASAVRTTSPLSITTGGTYHLGDVEAFIQEIETERSQTERNNDVSESSEISLARLDLKQMNDLD